MSSPQARSKMEGRVRRSTIVLRHPTPLYQAFYEQAELSRQSMNELAAVLIYRFLNMPSDERAAIAAECETIIDKYVPRCACESAAA